MPLHHFPLSLQILNLFLFLIIIIPSILFLSCTSTKRGSRRRGETNTEIDRLSSLPDDILAHILSFLTTKESVQTCILSKRWSNVWASAPVLKVTEREFRTPNHGVENKRECIEQFVRFVNGVLENRKSSCLDTFEIFCSIANCQNHSAEWLRRVAALKPRVFVFRVETSGRLNLPESVSSHESLTHLTSLLYAYEAKMRLKTRSDLLLYAYGLLYGKFVIPDPINLPSLKVLKLVSVKLDDDVTQKLLSGCPALESLVLCWCALSISDITSNVLKNLDIIFCSQTQKMKISCPRLVSLSINFVDSKGGYLSLENMSCLAMVDIRLQWHIPNVLRDLSNVTNVKLYGRLQDLEQLKKDIPTCRTFNNLKSLEIGKWDMSTNFDLVACFLKIAPNLQKLHLEFGRDGHTKGQPGQEAMRDVLAKLKHLEMVKISGGTKVQVDKLV